MRWRDDYDFPYYPKSHPRRVASGIKTKSQRGAIGETWWSKRWIQVLESFNMGARLGRGRSYARQGQVIELTIQVGEVTARVQGSRAKPYGVTIRLKPLSGKDWASVTDVMAARAIFAAKLLAGEMPQNIEEAFNDAKRPLMPTSVRELETDCSCPDWANPCKHIAAVYYILAERFDEDPFMIFKLRGRTKERIIEELRAKRAIAESKSPSPSPLKGEGKGEGENGMQLPLDQVSELEPTPQLPLDTFWQAGPGLRTFVTHPPVPDIPKAILKRLGQPPFDAEGQRVSECLEQAYDAVAAAALKKASDVSSED